MKIIARFRTSSSCRMSFVDNRSTSLRTAFFLNFIPDLEGIIPTESALLRVLSGIFSATDKGRFRFWPCSTLVPRLTTVDHSILLNRLSSGTEYRVLRSTGCNPSSLAVHRRLIAVVRSQGVLSCDLELRRDQYWTRSCTSSTQQMSRNVWNRSVLESISMPMTLSFTI